MFFVFKNPESLPHTITSATCSSEEWIKGKMVDKASTTDAKQQQYLHTFDLQK
jgi:hypothetical protein